MATFVPNTHLHCDESHIIRLNYRLAPAYCSTAVAPGLEVFSVPLHAVDGVVYFQNKWTVSCFDWTDTLQVNSDTTDLDITNPSVSRTVLELLILSETLILWILCTWNSLRYYQNLVVSKLTCSYNECGHIGQGTTHNSWTMGAHSFRNFGVQCRHYNATRVEQHC